MCDVMTVRGRKCGNPATSKVRMGTMCGIHRQGLVSLCTLHAKQVAKHGTAFVMIPAGYKPGLMGRAASTAFTRADTLDTPPSRW